MNVLTEIKEDRHKVSDFDVSGDQRRHPLKISHEIEKVLTRPLNSVWSFKTTEGSIYLWVKIVELVHYLILS